MASSTLAACGGSGDTTSDLPEEINIGYLRVPNDEKIAKTEALFDEYFADKGIRNELPGFRFRCGSEPSVCIREHRFCIDG